MYIRKVHIENIRSISTLDWEVPEGKEAGWHVLIGDNGAGKSTLLRAIALAVLGENEWAGLRQKPKTWIREGAKKGRIILHPSGYRFTPGDVGGEINNETLSRPIDFSIDANGIQASPHRLHDFSILPDIAEFGFTAAYGPFRRFSGGDEGSQSIYESLPRLGAHLSLFGENFALTEALKWLGSLKFKALENKPEGNLLEHLIEFINQPDFLPHQAKLVEVSSDGVLFADREGRQFPVTELSDGYRSILSLTFELIRQMDRVFALNQIFGAGDTSKIIAPGAVLIDEVDAHLHPTWQRRIGFWFRKHFPNIQFIVTTHSPLICQAAEVGSVWHLPAPGSGETLKQVTGDALRRLIYGNVLEAYGTEVFGENVSRSDSSKEKLERLAELNRKELRGKMTAKDKKEQAALRAMVPTSAHVLAEE